MSETSEGERLNDLCLRGLLRWLRGDAVGLSVAAPRLGRADLQAVRMYWALSDWVDELARRVLVAPREVREVLDTDETVTSGELTGFLDARETLILQGQTGDSTLFVVQEHYATMQSGPNQLVVWTLNEALRLILWALRKRAGAVPIERLAARAKVLEDALRVHSLREVLLTPAGRVRPGAASLREAGRSRVPLYRLAHEAFRALQDVEALDRIRLRAMFSQALISSTEEWQRFELAAALSVTDAISSATGTAPEMDLTIEAGRPLAKIGRFSVRWQFSQSPRPPDRLDSSELLARTLSESLNVSASSGRADVAVFVDGVTEPVALIECKWFTSEDSRQGAVLGACEQLVRYARDAHPESIAEAEALLGRSVVIVARRGEAPDRVDCSGPINCTDLSGLAAGSLNQWAGCLIARYPGSTALAA